MNSFYSRLCLGTLLLLLFAGGHSHAGDKGQSAFFTDYLWQWDDIEKKITGLAEAIPAEKYSWRPAEGVRSIREVVAHVAGGNYFIPSLIGIKPPESVSMEMEKTIKEKSEAIKTVKESFEHVRKALTGMTDADLDKPAELFGNKTTVRNALFVLLSHTHEHLGQLIAYGRSNGVVPPWSAAQQSEEAEE